jgi:hypothetical protein
MAWKKKLWWAEDLEIPIRAAASVPCRLWLKDQAAPAIWNAMLAA